MAELAQLRSLTRERWCSALSKGAALMGGALSLGVARLASVQVLEF